MDYSENIPTAPEHEGSEALKTLEDVASSLHEALDRLDALRVALGKTTTTEDTNGTSMSIDAQKEDIPKKTQAPDGLLGEDAFLSEKTLPPHNDTILDEKPAGMTFTEQDTHDVTTEHDSNPDEIKSSFVNTGPQVESENNTRAGGDDNGEGHTTMPPLKDAWQELGYASTPAAGADSQEDGNTNTETETSFHSDLTTVEQSSDTQTHVSLDTNQPTQAHSEDSASESFTGEAQSYDAQIQTDEVPQPENPLVHATDQIEDMQSPGAPQSTETNPSLTPIQDTEMPQASMTNSEPMSPSPSAASVNSEASTEQVSAEPPQTSENIDHSAASQNKVPEKKPRRWGLF